MWKRLWTKALLYMKGVRFFPVLSKPSASQLYQVDLITVNDSVIEISFYKEENWEAIFKRGKLQSRKVTGYVIKAKFDETCPELVAKYDNIMVFFHGYQLAGLDDKVVFEYLLEVFMTYLKVLAHP